MALLLRSTTKTDFKCNYRAGQPNANSPRWAAINSCHFLRECCARSGSPWRYQFVSPDSHPRTRRADASAWVSRSTRAASTSCRKIADRVTHSRAGEGEWREEQPLRRCLLSCRWLSAIFRGQFKVLNCPDRAGKNVRVCVCLSEVRSHAAMGWPHSMSLTWPKVCLFWPRQFAR